MQLASVMHGLDRARFLDGHSAYRIHIHPGRKRGGIIQKVRLAARFAKIVRDALVLGGERLVLVDQVSANGAGQRFLRSDGERSRSLDGRESDGGDDADRASGHVDVAGKAERRLSGSDDESRPNKEAPDEPFRTDADRDDDSTSQSSSDGPGSTATAADDSSPSGSSGEAIDDERADSTDSESETESGSDETRAEHGSGDSSGSGSGSDDASSDSNSGRGGGDPND